MEGTASPHTPAAFAGATAIVCDADAISARFLARALGRTGLHVSTCDTAAACEDQVGAQRPQLVVLSILLPDLDGLALTRRLRAQHDAGSGAPKIIVASVLQAEQRALEAGADAFLLKPVAPADLVRVATGLLAKGTSQTEHSS